MPDWPIAKICASSSTPKESLLSTRKTFRRSGSPPALHRAASSSQGSNSNWGARRVMVAQSSRSFFIQQYQYQKVLILVLLSLRRLSQRQESRGCRAQTGAQAPQHMQLALDLQVLYRQMAQFAAGQFALHHSLRQPGNALAVS